jgi:hypothetical protein
MACVTDALITPAFSPSISVPHHHHHHRKCSLYRQASLAKHYPSPKSSPCFVHTVRSHIHLATDSQHGKWQRCSVCVYDHEHIPKVMRADAPSLPLGNGCTYRTAGINTRLRAEHITREHCDISKTTNFFSAFGPFFVLFCWYTSPQVAASNKSV